MTLNAPRSSVAKASLLRRPIGRMGHVLLTLAIATAPAILFFDPVHFGTGRGHISREPLEIYQLFSDDVAYVASSRTWERTISILFVPHNTHIVPAWRILTWALVASAGKLERLPKVLAFASYSILVVVMLLTGRLIERETGRTMVGLVAMALVGTTSLLVTPATWYSAGQPLWAGLGILATLWYAQCYRRSGGWPALMMAALAAPVAGWFWTVGHMAGPAAALYLWADGRRRCRLAAAVPLVATMLAVVFSLALAARQIDSTVSFHGRTIREAVDPVQGLLHTGQAIPENLIFGNLGLSVRTTQAQGALLTLALFALWTKRWWSARGTLPATDVHVRPPNKQGGRAFPFQPLECAGAAMVIGAYLMEWSFRGYLEFKFLRTINLHFLVPWYDAIPQVGAVLLATGWWSALRPSATTCTPFPRPTPPATWSGALAVFALLVVMIGLNRPRVDFLARASVLPLLPSERLIFPNERLQTMRANAVLLNHAKWQRAYLRRLDRAEVVAKRMGWSRETLRTALGHPWVPGTVGYLRQSLYELYDAVGLLDLSRGEQDVDPAIVRASLSELFAKEQEPRPAWIAADEPWPPIDDNPRIPR